jgi:MscS family membrane protein
MEPSPCFFGGAWAIELLIAALIFLFANFGLKKVLKLLRRKFLRPAPDWREKLDQIFYRPLLMILWVLAVAYFLDVVGRWLHFPSTFSHLKPFRDALIICCLGWLFLKWKKEIQHSLIARPQGKHLADSGVIWILGRLLSMVILIVTALLVLGVMGMNIAPLIAFGGIGAAAVGFAGKDVIANFFGGLMLYITRPFTMGDQIEIPERNIEGVVEDIGWYLTAIRDKDKCPVYLPNSMFSTILVINSSRMTHRRIEERVKIRFRDLSKIDALTQEIRKMITSHRTIDADQNIFVAFDTVGDSGFQIYIDAYSLETDQELFLAVKQEVLIAVQKILDAHDVKLSYPTTTVELPDGIIKG